MPRSGRQTSGDEIEGELMGSSRFFSLYIKKPDSRSLNLDLARPECALIRGI